MRKLIAISFATAAVSVAAVPTVPAHAAGKHKDKSIAAIIKHNSFPFRCPGPKPC
jgi:hypothetical protein